jgi:hypothetical protein
MWLCGGIEQGVIKNAMPGWPAPGDQPEWLTPALEGFLTD